MYNTLKKQLLQLLQAPREMREKKEKMLILYRIRDYDIG